MIDTMKSAERTPTLHALAACPICERTFGEARTTVTVKDPFGVSSDWFKLVRCESCGTYVLNPRPSMKDMGVFYESDFLMDTTTQSQSLIDRVAAKQQELNLASEIRWILRHLNDGDAYLDYSAGNGQIVELIAKRRPGARVFATEFSSQYREWIAARIGGERVRESIADFPPELRFDLISAFGVLEHVEEPRALIRELRARLTPRGKLMLSVPNPDSLQRSLTGRRWYSWLAPRHWHLMRRRTLLRMLREEGFEIDDEKHFFLRSSSSTLVLSLFPSLDPLLPQKSVGLLTYALLFYLFIPLELIAAAFRKAGFMGAVARLGRTDG